MNTANDIKAKLVATPQYVALKSVEADLDAYIAQVNGFDTMGDPGAIAAKQQMLDHLNAAKDEIVADMGSVDFACDELSAAAAIDAQFSAR